MLKRSIIASVLLGFTLSQAYAEQKNEQSSEQTLIAYQKKLSKMERKMEMLRQENQFLQEQMRYIQSKKKYEKVVDGDLPGVLAIFGGEHKKARVLFESGIERVVDIGDKLNKKTKVIKITENDVVVRNGRKTSSLKMVKQNHSGSSSNVNDSRNTLPSPIVH